MKRNSKIITGILFIVLLTTGVLSVQAANKPYLFNVSAPGLNQSTWGASQTKHTSNRVGYLNVYTISGKLDARAEQGRYTATGPWVRLTHANAAYTLENSIKKGGNIQVRFSSDVTSYLPSRATGDFQGN